MACPEMLPEAANCTHRKLSKTDYPATGEKDHAGVLRQTAATIQTTITAV
ncbi:MAG TPA: hypothetical protein PKC55_10795 [Dysgonomonas sp.]|nr:MULTISPECIES: hypothetical protein [unclassified Dysgonomonas]HML65307.1 hypothetical protein [Dysgonomonas sp.]